MKAIPRFLGNLLIAAVMIALAAVVLVVGYGAALSGVWENVSFDAQPEGGAWAWLNAEPFYYQSFGDESAPAVVLIHGFAMEGHRTWSSNAEALAQAGTRVIVVDLKGFGYSVRDPSPMYSVRSQATYVADLLQQLNVKRATVVGHDWGSAVALQLAIENPQVVQRLALLAPTNLENPLPWWRSIAKVPYLGQGVAWVVDGGGPVWSLLRRSGFHTHDEQSDAYLRLAREPLRIRGTIAALVAMARSEPDDDLPEALRSVSVPTLILVGAEDKLVSARQQRALAARLPDAKVVVISEAGHLLQAEQPGQVNGYLSAFALRGAR